MAKARAGGPHLSLTPKHWVPHISILRCGFAGCRNPSLTPSYDPQAFGLWLHVGGKIEPGLVARRKAEMQMFTGRSSARPLGATVAQE